MNKLIEYLTEKAENDELSVVNVKGGAAVEMIDIEIQKVLENIDNPNTTSKPRKVIFEIVFAPNDEKTTTWIEIHCRSSLAGPEPIKAAARIHTGKNGRPALEEINRQRDIPFDNVKNIKKRGE